MCLHDAWCAWTVRGWEIKLASTRMFAELFSLVSLMSKCSLNYKSTSASICYGCCREHVPGGAQGVPQRVPHMPSIPNADGAGPSFSSAAQQAGRPFQSAEMLSSAPVTMDSVFPSSMVIGRPSKAAMSNMSPSDGHLMIFVC